MARFPRLLSKALIAAFVALLVPEAAPADRRKGSEQYGIIPGSVFEESGRSLPGARVTVTPKPTEARAVPGNRAKNTVSDSRGEFAVRVPAGAMRYTVRVEAKGFQAEEKDVTVERDQHVDLFFRLKAAREEGGKPK